MLVAAGFGCSGRSWTNPPDELLGRPWQNLNQPTPDAYPDPEQATTAGLDAAFGNDPNPTPPPPQVENRSRNVLALAAGGKYVAYSAGVLSGWTATGTRPQFDVVTGVSGGALLAIYALPRSGVRCAGRRAIRQRHPPGTVPLPPRSREVRSYTEPSRQAAPFAAALIERELSDATVAEIARAHCAGRRLYIATGNRTSLRMAIWDVGAVAASGRPDAAALVRKIALAAVSFPGLAPTVEFDVTVNGVQYHELHGDAGNIAQVFVRTANGLPPESNVYVIGAGKVYRDPRTETPQVLSTLIAAASKTHLYAPLPGRRIHTCTPSARLPGRSST